MIARKCTIEDLFVTLDFVNRKYHENIRWNRAPEKCGARYRFTLRVNSRTGPGAKRGFSGRRTTAACWHVHGHFFDTLFRICPSAIIRAGNQKITKETGNWQDRNIGSDFHPLMYSESCECRHEKRYQKRGL